MSIFAPSRERTSTKSIRYYSSSDTRVKLPEQRHFMTAGAPSSCHGNHQPYVHTVHTKRTLYVQVFCVLSYTLQRCERRTNRRLSGSPSLGARATAGCSSGPWPRRSSRSAAGRPRPRIPRPSFGPPPPERTRRNFARNVSPSERQADGGKKVALVWPAGSGESNVFPNMLRTRVLAADDIIGEACKLSVTCELSSSRWISRNYDTIFELIKISDHYVGAGAKLSPDLTQISFLYQVRACFSTNI